jgi:hypothetical protein
MSLFDFFRSEEDKEKERYLLEIQNNIFPNGNTQIENEIRELREIFNFKYTYQEIYTTYIHATAIHYISKDKSKATIVSSILHNRKSYLTKVDAEKLYDYIDLRKTEKLKITNIAEIRDNMSHPDRLSFVIKGGLIFLKKYKDITDYGKFEVFIFNTIIALSLYKKNHPNNYDNVEDMVIFSLFEQAKIYIDQIDKEWLNKFVIERFDFYTKELNNIGNSPLKYVPTKIYSNFYELPLTMESKKTDNVMESMIFHKYLLDMINWVTQHSNKI